MEDVVAKIVEADDSQLSCEEKSMLVNALLDDLEINHQLSTTSSTADNNIAQAAIVQPQQLTDEPSLPKEGSQALPSPQQPKAQSYPCIDGESSPDKNAPPSQNSSAVTATSHKVELQVKGKDIDPKEKLIGDDDNLIDDDHDSFKMIEKTSSSSNDEIEKEPKETLAPTGSQLTLASNETKKDPSELGIEVLLESDDDPETDRNAHVQESLLSRKGASERVASECTLVLLQAEEQLCVVEVNDDDDSNGESGKSNIHKQKAACRECKILVSEENRVWNIKCKCTDTSLIHEDCKNEWSQKLLGNKCPNCDDDIKTMAVKLLPIPPQTAASPLLPPLSTSKRSTWFCFCKC